MYRSVLASRKILVIADDAAYAAQVRPLVPAAGGAAVLVTSRSPLIGLSGSRQVHHVHIGELARADALELLTGTVGRSRVSAEPAAAAEIVTACGGMPLAVRLATAVLATQPGLSLCALADACRNRLLDALIAEDSSVRVSIGASYHALTARARATASLAATRVPGEISCSALTELASGDATVAGKIVAVGLLQPAGAAAPGTRYRMHPLVRAYLSERASEHAGGLRGIAASEP